MINWNKVVRKFPKEVGKALQVLGTIGRVQASNGDQARHNHRCLKEGRYSEMDFEYIDNDEMRRSLYGNKVFIALDYELNKLIAEIDFSIDENRRGVWMSDDPMMNQYVHQDITHRFNYIPPSQRKRFEKIKQLLVGVNYQLLCQLEERFIALPCGRVLLKTKNAYVILTPPQLERDPGCQMDLAFA